LDDPVPKRVAGQVIQWVARPSQDGVILHFEIARSVDEYLAGEETSIKMALNDRQLKALAVDMVKSALMQGVEFTSPKKWWRFW
jgi:hypothetical protein